MDTMEEIVTTSTTRSLIYFMRFYPQTSSHITSLSAYTDSVTVLSDKVVTDP